MVPSSGSAWQHNDLQSNQRDSVLAQMHSNLLMSDHSPVRLSLRELEEFDPRAPAGGRRRFCCPLCGTTKPRDGVHRCLSVESATGLWHCFRCAQGGILQEFWRDVSSREERHERTTRQLRTTFHVPVAPKTLSDSKIPSVNRPSAGEIIPVETLEVTRQGEENTERWRSLWEGALPLGESDRGGDYLLTRRALRELVLAPARLRFHPTWLGGAVVFPLCDARGEAVAIQGRAVQGDAKITHGAKKDAAFFAPAMLSGGQCFGPLHPLVPWILLTEAPIDALSLAICGFPALALCGTSGPSWLHLACGLRRVALAFDADEAGERAAAKHAAHLHLYGAKCLRLRPEVAKDWNEMLKLRGANDLDEWLSLRLL